MINFIIEKKGAHSLNVSQNFCQPERTYLLWWFASFSYSKYHVKKAIYVIYNADHDTLAIDCAVVVQIWFTTSKVGHDIYNQSQNI